MKINTFLSVVAATLLGCSSQSHSHQSSPALRDVKLRVMQLHAGMERREVEAVLRPLPDPSLDISISGVVGVPYRLRPSVWVIVRYGDSLLLDVPNELLVTKGTASRDYNHIPLAEIE